jgi:hypothetical protein
VGTSVELELVLVVASGVGNGMGAADGSGVGDNEGKAFGSGVG